MQVKERFLKYVSYWTTADENNMEEGKPRIPPSARRI